MRIRNVRKCRDKYGSKPRRARKISRDKRYGNIKVKLKAIKNKGTRS